MVKIRYTYILLALVHCSFVGCTGSVTHSGDNQVQIETNSFETQMKASARGLSEDELIAYFHHFRGRGVTGYYVSDRDIKDLADADKAIAGILIDPEYSAPIDLHLNREIVEWSNMLDDDEYFIKASITPGYPFWFLAAKKNSNRVVFVSASP